ncbi:alkaline phosphatase family protein [delta proteobacterium NaphS2]|nr:alkaline phosphatase family protein [delta proteobacterium NaphS2]
MKSYSKKFFKFSCLTSFALLILLGVTSTTSHAGTPKYIFYFIGDGMANVQVHAAEAYLAALQGKDEVAGSQKAKLLAMSHFPVQGLSTTFANNRLITGSAAAGTALACGMKTNIGVISMNPDATRSYTTVAELAKAKGMKVGIVSSVSIDHATPAVFYAHQPSRSNYHEIAMALANSDFDYFAGGGFHDDETGTGNAIETAQANGFTYVKTRQALAAVTPGNRVIATDNFLMGGSALAYELDRVNAPETLPLISLAEFTSEGIRLLDNDNGFFMMVEGGKIDWACHANDARAAIDDTIAFDNAIREALNFYMLHPDDTLIVVTADHECGGQTIGFAGTAYDTFFEVLAKQQYSYEVFDEYYVVPYKENHNPAPADIDANMWALILEMFGLDGTGATADEWDDLTEYDKERLEAAFDKTMSGESVNLEEEDRLLYGSYEPLTVTLTHILNQKAGIAWTSYSHTGVPVPVLTIGNSSTLFDGFYDNTDIAKKIAEALGMPLLNVENASVVSSQSDTEI